MTPLHKSAFVPFHGFSPVLRSFRVAFSVILSPHSFDFIVSFPLLEDLTVIACDVRTNDDGVWVRHDTGSDNPPTVNLSQNSPVFTGSLELSWGGVKYVS